MSTTPHIAVVQAFIGKWQVSGAAERANAQLFLSELCDVLEVDRPRPQVPEEAANDYCFEKAIPTGAGTTNFIDLYKRGCFVLETKQGADAVGSDDRPPAYSAAGAETRRTRKTGHGIRGTKGFDTAMIKAHAQAQRYARTLPPAEIPEGRPPFVLVVDVGHSISLYADWTRMGGEYLPFPDPAAFRIPLKDLVRPEVRDTLRAVWTDPLSLDPGRRSAKVTREIADRLARLARSLEGKHPPEAVAAFLMRALFTMFAEDVDLLPHNSFTRLLAEMKEDPALFTPMLENLWATMNTGGLSPILRKKLPRFNGGLFAHADAIALNADQIQLLLEAAQADWKDVEPAIFGTLLERALDPRERHKLGAHYTPRAYVERLVNPTVIEPLRAQWKSVQVAALHQAEEGRTDKAVQTVERFLFQLGQLRVLDPACGSGNFLYVTLELLKRLEGEVLNTLAELGQTYKLEYNTHTISPANFLGIELNPRAAAIAEQVLWIGFLQWQLRTHGHLHNIPEPIIKDLHNIQCRDAVLDYDSKEEQRDADGHVVTKWDGRTTKTHPVTGKEVPDPEAREPVYTYTNPRPATWPEADYIVGNPPFIGTARMREALGDGYTEALRGVYKNVPDSADFVMYWWDKAAEQTRLGKVKRFGLITTNSLRQTFNRKVLQHHMEQKKPISLAFAIPDHPWVDSADGAAVRVAMTVGYCRKGHGILMHVSNEVANELDGIIEVTLNSQHGNIMSDIRIGADVSNTVDLASNSGIATRGVLLVGGGFIITPDEAKQIGLEKGNELSEFIRPYMTGRDIQQRPSNNLVIDLYDLAEEEVLNRFPEVYQWVKQRVKPNRDENRDAYRRTHWWLFGRTHEDFRRSTTGLSRFIVTARTAKHRIFTFVDGGTRPESEVVAIAIQDAFTLGVLSSQIHVIWALATGSTLEDRPRYTHTRCFLPFPFPACTPAQQEKIRALGEQLDAHRKRQQALHPELTMTGMYNVLERVRALEVASTHRVDPLPPPLTAKEKVIYEQGLVGILKQLHDELDAAVAEAYGWGDLAAVVLGSSDDMHPAEHRFANARTDSDEILTRLVALNAERAAEEAQGHIRWLRPEYQAPEAQAPVGQQAELPVETEDQEQAAPVAAELRPWPKELPEQAAALSEVLEAQDAPATLEAIAHRFAGRTTDKRLRDMERLLRTLEAVGTVKEREEKWGT